MEQRVTALESRVTDLTGQVKRAAHDAAAARVLAGGADRDVEEVRGEIRDFRKANEAEIREFRRANAATINALRQDMLDGFARVDERFAQVDANFTQVSANFAQVDANFVGVRGMLDAAAAGHDHIVGLLTTMMRQDSIDPES